MLKIPWQKPRNGKGAVVPSGSFMGAALAISEVSLTSKNFAYQQCRPSKGGKITISLSQYYIIQLNSTQVY